MQPKQLIVANAYHAFCEGDSLTDNLLETSRLYLRQLQTDDYLSLRLILQDTDVMYAWEHAFSDVEVTDWLNECIMRYSRDGYSHWAVIEKSSNILVGVCGIISEQADNENHVGIGYIFNKQYWGMGYAIESASACVDYAFHNLKLDEITAQIRPDNASSKRVAEKLGMRVKKQFVKKYRYKDIPHLLYYRTA